MTHIKVPKDRVGAIIGPKGRVKEIIENKSTAKLDIDSENGTVEIIPGDDRGWRNESSRRSQCNRQRI